MINLKVELKVTMEWSQLFNRRSGLINGTGNKGNVFIICKKCKELMLGARVCLQPAGTSFNCFPIWKLLHAASLFENVCLDN